MSTRDLMSPDPVEKMINIYDNHEPQPAKQLRQCVQCTNTTPTLWTTDWQCNCPAQRLCHEQYTYMSMVTKPGQNPEQS